ncbi:MAG: amidase [Acidobacteria bacterium]|nr:amidase [Acidobacteriota bacterium]
MDRRDFMKSAAVAAVGAFAARSAFADEALPSFEEASVYQLQAAMAAGKTTSRAVTQWYLTRIATIDKKVNSIIEVNPDALVIAAEMDKERNAGKIRGPLHGVPIVIKDNIETADKMKTTAGSLALVDAPTPKQDAFLVARLREAGAVLIGKTNLSEWANFRDGASISGWSGRGRQTHNPYILDRNACGSSSGTGAAIAANLAAIGVGTETDGSIVCPSSICGIVGIKPTVGLVSRSGIIPISANQDTAGPMCRSVADAATLLSVLDAADADDVATTANGKRPRIDYRPMLRNDGLNGMRIGVARDYYGKLAEVDAIIDASLAVIKRLGATVVDIKIPNLGKYDDAENTVLQYDFKAQINDYLRGRGGRMKSLEDLIKFNTDNAAKEMPYFKQSIFEASQKRGDLKSKEYREALDTCRKLSREEGIDAVMKKEKLDAIVAHSNSPTWMIDKVNGDCFSSFIGSSTPAAVAGYPAITLPAGFLKELPIGITFMGGPWQEGKLISMAYAYEQATKARRAPKYLPTYA